MLNSLFILASILFVIFSFGVGIFSLAKNPKSRVVKVWFLTSMAIGLWGIGLLLLLVSKTEQQAFLYSKLLHIGAAFIPIFFCHFILIFLYQEQKRKTFLILGYILATVFTVLTFTGSLMVSKVVSDAFGFNFWFEVGSLYFVFITYFSLYAISAIYFLTKGYKQNDGIRRRQIFFLLIATIVGFGGGMSNFLPQTAGIYPFGHFVAWLYPLFITYGIFIDEVKIKF